MRVFLLAIVSPLVLAAATSNLPPCDHSIESANRLEHDILGKAKELNTPSDFHKIAEPLRCLFEMQQHGEGIAKYLAEKYLNPLLGASQIKGYAHDPRYAEVAKYLEDLTLQAKDPLNGSVVKEYAEGDWNFYRLFCEQGDTSFCPTFLPDNEMVSSQNPLLAAASMMRLRKAYQVLKGKEREKVAERLRELYREIPQSAKLKRQFIDQIYNEIFKTGISFG